MLWGPENEQAVYNSIDKFVLSPPTDDWTGLGLMIAQFILRARTAKTFILPQGATLRIINTHGSQVVDTWAFCTEICDEFMSMEHTRVHAKSPMPNVGTVFRTNKRRPILKFITDTSAGLHDWFYAACDQQRYEIWALMGTMTTAPTTCG